MRLVYFGALWDNVGKHCSIEKIERARDLLVIPEKRPSVISIK